ncbi:MAG: hypothetical protein GY774_27430 [Planctomycetes bacterium]|nr:hypothetical protein [Planctomycetota bacterium]
MGLTAKPIPILMLVGIALVIAAGLLIVGTSLRVYKATSSQVVRYIADMPADVWERLTEVAIFFGHKSVGYNIVDGIRDLMDSYGFLNFRINEAKAAGRVNGAMLVHAPVGWNLEPGT